MTRNKKTVRIVSGILTAAVSASAVSCAVSAAEQNTPKEEVVYVNLNWDGSVKEINVVNSFEQKEAGTIVDYGTYESLRNMTTTDAIAYENDQVTIAASAEKLYYEGKLDSTVTPWEISIRYELDGKEYPVQELAGKNGKLKITVDIGQNKAYKGNFFDDFALQASLTLDTGKCSNIKADGATIANVGSNKQLTYTILPGKETHLTVTADVTAFEMDSIAINALPLNLDVEVDDKELMDQVTELLEAIEKLDDGAGELADGVQDLQDGAQDELKDGVGELASGTGQLQSGAGELVSGGTAVKSGAQDLKEGADALDGGVRELQAGIAQVQAGLDAIDEKSGELTGGSAQMKEALLQLQTALGQVSASAQEIQALVTASADIRQAIDQVASGMEALSGSVSCEAYKAVMQQNGLDIDALKAGNAEAAQSLNDMMGQVDGWFAILDRMSLTPEAKQSIENAKNQGVALASQIINLLNGNNAALAGTESYFQSASQGASELAAGTAKLQENYQQFDSAVSSLADTLTGLMSQMTLLKDAVNQLVEEYTKLDNGLNEYTEGVSQITSGYTRVSGGAQALAEGSSALKKGSADLYSAMELLLNGIVEFYDATGTLRDGTGALDNGVTELLDGIAALYEGSGELKDGTDELRTETSGMDQEIEDQINELLDSISGGEKEVRSFTSEKNKNIESVQFVIKTEGIEIPEEQEEIVEETEKESFMEKLTGLFK